jgi:hypothetical protein
MNIDWRLTELIARRCECWVAPTAVNEAAIDPVLSVHTSLASQRLSCTAGTETLAEASPLPIVIEKSVV